MRPLPSIWADTIHSALGHSLGLDVHDVPSASRPEPESENKTIPELSHKHPLFYTYLRLRLPLEAGMVLVSEDQTIVVWS
jgi:Xaa-Pro dipeptidase